MVNAPLTERKTEGRAQLVLIGAISIAFILLGVVVVFNGVQYTETVNNGETGEGLTNAETTDKELEAGIAGLIEHHDPTDGGPTLNSEIKTYIEEHYRPAKANQRPVSITIENVNINGTVTIGSDIDVAITYTYRTNSGTITRELDVTRTVGDAL